MVVLGVYGLLVWTGVAQSRSAAVPYLAAVSEVFEDWDYGGDRVIEGDTPRAVLFVGDSHMAQYLPRIEKLVTDHDRPLRTVIFSTQMGCAPVPGIEREGRTCARFVDDSMALARSKDVATVVIQRPPGPALPRAATIIGSGTNRIRFSNS